MNLNDVQPVSPVSALNERRNSQRASLQRSMSSGINAAPSPSGGSEESLRASAALLEAEQLALTKQLAGDMPEADDHNGDVGGMVGGGAEAAPAEEAPAEEAPVPVQAEDEAPAEAGDSAWIGVVALFDFPGVQDGDLPFAEGDVFEVGGWITACLLPIPYHYLTIETTNHHFPSLPYHHVLSPPCPYRPMPPSSTFTRTMAAG